VKRTPQTERQYLTRGRSLVIRYERATGVAVGEDPEAFVDWLDQQKTAWDADTWRQYKASARLWLEQTGFSEAAGLLAQMSSEGCKPPVHRARARPRKTSASKSKTVSEAEEHLITGALRARKDNYWTLRTLVFLQASIIAGLRPLEWAETQWLAAMVDDDGKWTGPFLRVHHAKATNGRAHGEFRHLDLSELRPEAIAVLGTQLAWMRAPSGPKGGVTAEAYVEACRKCLYSVAKDLWPRRRTRPTLYSGRHQFAADLKAAGYSRAEVAALMGHGIGDTVHNHYGRRRSGRKRSGMVRPYGPEVARIRQAIGLEARLR